MTTKGWDAYMPFWSPLFLFLRVKWPRSFSIHRFVSKVAQQFGSRFQGYSYCCHFEKILDREPRISSQLFNHQLDLPGCYDYGIGGPDLGEKTAWIAWWKIHVLNTQFHISFTGWGYHMWLACRRHLRSTLTPKKGKTTLGGGWRFKSLRAGAESRVRVSKNKIAVFG